MPPNTRRRGPQPNPDLPSLFPTHDGSYGINTLINTDTESKKGHKTNMGIAKEQSDDKQWSKSVRGKTGRKYGMNSDLKTAIGESHQEVEKEHQEQDSTKSLNSNASRSTDPPSPSSTSRSSSHSVYGIFGGGDGGPPAPPNDPAQFLPPNSHVPIYDPNNPPFSEEPDHRRRPPYTRVGLPSSNLHAIVGVSQPASSRSEYIPFYGMPQGEGSGQPISPTRPDTSRSFKYESGLFSNATFRTPSPMPGFGSLNVAKAINQASTQNPWLRQDTTGGQPTSKTTGGQPSLKTTGGPPDKDISGGQADSNITRVQPDKNAASERPKPNTTKKQPRQNTTGEQPSPKPRPDSIPPELPGGLKDSHGKNASGGQPDPKSSPDYSQQRTQRPSARLRVSIVSKEKREQALRDIMRENALQTPQFENRGENPNNSTGPTSPPDPSRQGAAKNESGLDRPWAFVRQSVGLICPLLTFFMVLAMVLWASFTAIQALSYNRTGLYSGGFGSSNFSIGSSLWHRIANLLPEVPDIHNTTSAHNTMRPLDCGSINYETLITELKRRMPDAIWALKDKHGQIRIPEDFWHALRELIRGDDSILTLENSHISDDHWSAIKSRIQTTGSGPSRDGASKTGASEKDIETLVQDRISRSWDSWLKKNEESLRKTYAGVALTKDDFLKLFKEEASSYQREIGQELVELRKRFGSISEQMSELQYEMDSRGGMTRNEIKNLVNTMISKAINNGQLDAIAKGLIKGHANDVMATQVNFFGIGAGATIDPTYTSSAWKIPKHHFKTKKYIDKDGYKAQPPRSALLPWTQEGECFCAGPDLKGYGQGTNNISVVTSRNIIPQHLVVEHILPGATLDAGAMPKEIEVWAYIEELTLRDEVRTFSKKEFPDTPNENVLNEAWIKIGHVTYENKNYGDGIQVFKLSDELAKMNAFTSQTVVRAINNYGADHTCFYRLKLYGETVERPDDPLEHVREKRFWS